MPLLIKYYHIFIPGVWFHTAFFPTQKSPAIPVADAELFCYKQHVSPNKFMMKTKEVYRVDNGCQSSADQT